MKRLWVRLSMAFSGVILSFLVLMTILGFLASGLGGDTLPPAVSARMRQYEILPPELQQQEIQQALAHLFRTLTVMGIAIGAVGLMAGIGMSRAFARPLNRLAEAARTIGTGDLSRRVDIKGTQEMMDVAVAFNQMASELEKATELRRSLMADVAHELRTPLTVLQGNLRAMLDDVYAMDKMEIARLYEQTRHLTRLIEDLRIVALAESRQLPLNLAKVDAVDFLKDVYASFEPIAAEEGINLSVRLPDEALLTYVDTARMKQVLYNLLSNAVRHTPKDGTITLCAILQEDLVAVTVSDTGEGIAAEHIEHVFDRFYRTDRARTRDTGGTGLGLAIVKALIEAQNGSVGVSSKGDNSGTDFTIWLPRCRPVRTTPASVPARSPAISNKILNS
ncbi:MAG: HAMP domain-containing histidine kinase [Anaerolineae bacterium]|nr:HAMP domain-containing histidine kinase [Anaerolineae bacterium]